MSRLSNIACSGVSRADFIKIAGAAVLSPALPAFAAKGTLVTKPIPKSKTGERLPVVGQGTATDFGDALGDPKGMAARGAVFQAMVDQGGTVIDTAPSYRAAEPITGQLVEQLKIRPKIFLATKVAERTADDGTKSFDNSFRDLRTNVIDLMQVHNLTSPDVQMPAMRKLKDLGRFRYIGVTHSSPGAQEGLADVMAKHDLDFIQLNYAVDIRDPEKRLLPMALDKGVAVMVNLPLGRGRLFRAVQGQQVPAWAKEELGCESWAQMLLKFVVSHPAVTVAIPGTTDAGHMIDNMGAAYGVMPDARQRERIAEIWKNA